MLHIFYHLFSKSQIQPCYGHKEQVPLPGTIRRELCVRAGKGRHLSQDLRRAWLQTDKQKLWAAMVQANSPQTTPRHWHFLPQRGTRTVDSPSTRKGAWLPTFPAFPRLHSRSPHTLYSHSGAVPSEADPTTWHRAVAASWWKPAEMPSPSLNLRRNLGL